MPPIPDVASHIAALFEQLGRVDVSGFSPAPLKYTEIAACAPWASERERNAVRDMSRDFLIGRNLGVDPFGIPPWMG